MPVAKAIKISPLLSSVPPPVRPIFIIAGLAAFAGFAVTGLFAAVAPAFVAKVIGIGNHALAGMIAGQAVSDPMSGFFLVRREAALKAAPKLASDGFKILIDLIVTSARMGAPLKAAEVPYTFRPRHAGMGCR